MRDLLLLNNLALGQDLHGIYALRITLPHLEDPAERPTADELQELEVAGGERALSLRGGLSSCAVDDKRVAGSVRRVGWGRVIGGWETGQEDGVERRPSEIISDGIRENEARSCAHLVRLERNLHSHLPADRLALERLQPDVRRSVGPNRA